MGGDEELSTALQGFTQAVLDEQKLNQEQREEVIELLSFLAEQGALPKEQRKKRLIGRTVANIANLCTIVGVTVPYLPGLWQQVAPIVQQFLG